MTASPVSSLRVREGIRQCMAWLHGWTGLMLGWLLLVICAAGTLSVFRPEIGRWTRPETVATVPPVAATEAAVAWLSRHAAGSPAWYLSPPDARSNTVQATYKAGDAFVTRALDPVTGAPVRRETLGGEFFYRLHFDLELPYPWGRILASLAAAFMLVAIVTGVIAHKKIFRELFTFRPARGQRSWLDAHNALGVLSLPFHAMITFTGLLTLATTTLPWGIVANYGADTARMFAEFTPGAVERAATGRRMPLAPVAPMMRQAERRFGGTGIYSLAIENPGDAAAVVTVLRADTREMTRIGQQIVFDGTTGRPIGGWIERGRPAVTTFNILYGLHMAHFASVLVRWLYFIGGMMLTGTVATGLVLWTIKRRERAPLSRGARIVERINMGMVTGLPIGFMAYFWANRLLPDGAADRAHLEVAATFWAWGAVLLAGLALPPARGWPILLAIAATACAGPALIGLADPVTAFPAALARGDLVLAGGDLTMLAMAAGFAHAARRATRPRTIRVRAPARAAMVGAA